MKDLEGRTPGTQHLPKSISLKTADSAHDLCESDAACIHEARRPGCESRRCSLHHCDQHGPQQAAPEIAHRGGSPVQPKTSTGEDQTPGTLLSSLYPLISTAQTEAAL